MCNELFHIQDEYFRKNIQRKHLNIDGALSNPKQLRTAIDVNNPATFQEYMLGEGADYSQMILNLEKAGKLGNVRDLAKYPLYNSMKGFVDENNYQRAQVFQFKETKNGKNPKNIKKQKENLERQKAKFEGKLNRKGFGENTVASLGNVQSLEQNLIAPSEAPTETESSKMDGEEEFSKKEEEELEEEEEEEVELNVQVVRFQEENHPKGEPASSNIQIQHGEDEWTSLNFPLSESHRKKDNICEDNGSEIQIVSLNRFTETKSKQRERSTENAPSTKRSDFLRCRVNNFHKVDSVNRNVEQFLSKSKRTKGTVSSEDPNYTLRSHGVDPSSLETESDNLITIATGKLTFKNFKNGSEHLMEDGVILEESEEHLPSVQDLDPCNLENNFVDQSEQNGKFFKVIRTHKTNQNHNFMATGASLDQNQLRILKNTLEKTKNGHKLKKEDLDQIELLNLQFLKEEMESKLNQLDSLDELQKKKFSVSTRQGGQNQNLVELAMRKNFMLGESVDANGNLRRQQGPQYIHRAENFLSYEGSQDNLNPTNIGPVSTTPSFNHISSQQNHSHSLSKDPVTIKEFSYNPNHPYYKQNTENPENRPSDYSLNTVSNGSHAQLLDEMRLYSDLNLNAELIESVFSHQDTHQLENQSQNSDNVTLKSNNIYVSQSIQLPLHERLSLGGPGGETNLSSREHSLLMAKMKEAVDLQ